MKASSILLLFLSLINSAISQNNISEIYQEGVLNGQFESRYPNGKLKAQGTYVDNLKSGEWNLWDSLGNVIMTRSYGNDCEFSVTTFKLETSKL